MSDKKIYNEILTYIDHKTPHVFVAPNIEEEHAEIYEDFKKQIYHELDFDLYPEGTRRAAEKSMFFYISVGDIAKIESYLLRSPLDIRHTDQNASSSDIRIGNVSEKPLSQALSIAISSITLATRASLDGGLPEHVAYALSDAYIRKLTSMNDAIKIEQLVATALYDFTYEVYCFHYRNCGQTVKTCCKYIMRHLHDPISLKTLAEVCGKSTNYVSDSFAKELGIRPIEFIRDRKLEYAKNSLEITSLPVSALADLLAFPSTSSFIGYFKDKYGITPLQYQKEHFNKG